jgi:hypothetical protein
MRDIREDLQERASILEQQIKGEHAEFEMLVAGLDRERNGKLENLRVQLRSTKKLVELANWHYNVRTTLLRAIALTAAAEISARKSLDAWPWRLPAAFH